VHSHTFDLTEASRERNPPHGRDVDSPRLPNASRTAKSRWVSQRHVPGGV